jgi:hypothetical protein
MSDITDSSFPFLRLPREIRDKIYRRLLSARLTTDDYNSGDYANWPVQFHPAISRTNKQISSEASKVLYGENEFVVLRVTTHTQKYNSLNGLPHFVGLSDNQIPHPVMEIKIKELEVGPLAQRIFVFTLGAFPSLIEHLWREAETFNYYNSMIFELFVFNKAPSRHALLNNRILGSFDQIQGFKALIFHGDIDTKVVRHLAECMTLGQHLQDVRAKMAELYSRGESFFKQKDCNLAHRYWNRLSLFWTYRYQLFVLTLTPALRTRYSIQEFMEATLTVILKMDLGRRSIELDTKQFQDAIENARVTLRVVGKLINWYSLNYAIPEVLEAKFWICQSVGQLALGKEGNATHSHNIAVNLLCQDTRFMGKSLEVSGWLKWARDSYLEEQCGRVNRTSMPEEHAEPKGLRSLGAWMDLSE